MASSTTTTTTTLFFLLLGVFLVSLPCVVFGDLDPEAFFGPQNSPPIAKGLSWNFYQSKCPKLESIVKNEIKKALQKDIGLAAALLRIHFHDCFVQGCDGSVMLDGSTSGPGEKNAPPNLTLRPAAFNLLNAIRTRAEKECGRVVSCSDLAALAARDSVALSGGPNYPVPLGRRDGLSFATEAVTLQFLPPPFAKVDALLDGFAKVKLDINDLVALSGGHTIGIAHCESFTDRLFPQDPVMDKTFANNLKKTCPTANFKASTNLDLRSPNVFDNKYYVDLMNRQGLFTSDQDLNSDSRTRELVRSFAIDQELFFEKFAFSMVKMGQLGVLTGNQGEIRANCSARNGGRKGWSVLDDEEDGIAASM